MKIKTIISAWLLTMAAFASEAQESNVLRVPVVDGVEGRSVSVPVEMSNTNPDITAMQFVITLPDEALRPLPDKVSLTDRRADHVVSATSKGAGRYLIIVYSPTNSPLSLNKGAVIEFPCTVQSGLAEGSTFPITLEDAILSDRNGDNVLSLSESGVFRIKNAADFTVGNVRSLTTSVKPGEEITLSYTVKNAGGSASGRWTEQVYLTSTAGDECFLGRNTPPEESLAAGASVQRTVEFTLPVLPGLDGTAKVTVKVVPETEESEPLSYRDNNTGVTAGSPVSVAGVLSLSPAEIALDEASDKAVKCKITRSGSWKSAQTFAIVATPAASRLLIPESVEIPAGQSGAYFMVKAMDNNVYDGTGECIIKVGGNAYVDAQCRLTITDDERPALLLTPSVETLTEGESVTLTVERTHLVDTPLVVSLWCEAPTRFIFPESVSLAAGEKSKTVTVTAVDNEDVDAEAMPLFKVSAPGFEGDECAVTLKDNDAPELKLTLTPAIVPENAGPMAVTAKLTRVSGSDGRIKVVLSDDSGRDIYYPNKYVIFEKGQTVLEFPLGVIDNAERTGDRTVNITAAVNIASCSCTVATDSRGASTASLEITEDDGPALSLSLARSTMIIGSREGVQLTLSRNSQEPVPLEVALIGSPANLLNFPAKVTIPAGEKSAVVEVSAKEDASIEEDTFVTLVSEADGYSKGSCVVMLSHSNYPDASLPSLTLEASEAFSGDDVTATVVVRNEGVTALPEATRVNIDLGGKLAASAYTTKALGAGEEESLSVRLPLGDRIGRRNIYATVNDSRQIRELNYNNNRSNTVELEIKSPYSAMVHADKDRYLKGEDVSLSGIVTGREVSGQPVEIYLINDNLRQTLTATTDEYGAFSAVFKPYSGQSGHFALGACYPGENKSAETASFEILGLDRTDSQIIKKEIYVNESASSSFAIKNTGSRPLEGLKVNVASVPEDCDVKVSCPDALAADASANVEFTLRPGSLTEGPKYQTVRLEISTAEGATLTVPVYYYCLSPKGLLKSELTELSTKMVKGKTREYPLTLSNRGDGPTGEISLSAPAWISVERGVIPSLAPGETAQVNLLLSSETDFQLNSVCEGTIAFNCENGSGFVLPYSIETVSETNGVLLVDAVDEYTYNTAEAPHLCGARVLVQHPATGAKIAEGTTGADGRFSVPLPEGYYELTVSADKHHTFNDYVVVEPGEEATYTLVTLGYIAHSFEFGVEETETEDVYNVVPTPTYETNVPVPVVIIDGPERFDGDNMADGESVLLTYTLTNHGLVSALNTRFIVPDDSDEWSWQALAYTEPFELRAKESVEVPVKVTRHIRSQAPARSTGTDIYNSFHNCVEKYKLLYEHMCGKDWKDNESAKKVMMKLCADEALASGLMGYFFKQGWGSGSGKGSGDGAPNYYEDDKKKGGDKEPTPFNKEHTLCNPCWADFADKNYDRATGWIPGGEYIAQARNDAYDWTQGSKNNGGEPGGDNPAGTPAVGGRENTREVRDYIANVIKDRIPEGKGQDLAGEVMDFTNDAIDYEECMKDLGKKPDAKAAPRKARKVEGWVQDHVGVAEALKEQYAHYIAGMDEFFGDEIWMASDDPTIDTFLAAFAEMDRWTVESCLSLKPAAVTTAQLAAFVERMNNTLTGSGENRCDIDKANAEFLATETADNLAAEKGYESMTAYFSDSRKDFLERMNEQSSAVCASVGLAIDQTVSMTRQAFAGYLKIFNGDDQSPMEDIIFNLEVRELASGKKVSSREMQIDVTDMDKFGGEPVLGSAWTLDAQATGKVDIRFIPTRYAAPEQPVDYSFGGTITYIDPVTGMQVTEKLMPVIKTVAPSPVLDLTYFLQRDIYADDPLTEEIEPAEDAEMALVIHNKGYGDADNVRITTGQPRIVDNQKGLLIDFTIVSSQIDGAEKTVSPGGAVPMEIGTIAASQSSLLQWWLRSSLLGHFTDYEVNYTHATSYGNENLSLIDQLSIHELIRGFTLSDGTSVKDRGFLVNDLTDKEDLPDAVYFSDGRETQPLSRAASVKMSASAADEYIVEIDPAAPGWNYGYTPDRTGGRKVITAVRRMSDNAEMPLDNFWQTSVTLRDGQDPVHQYLIHAVACQQSAESYLLTFQDRQDVALDISGMELERTGNEDNLYVSGINVTFNKDIDASTFTAEDLMLFRDGTRCALEDNAVEARYGNEFNVKIGCLAAEAGAYELKVRTDGVLDADGRPGKANRSVCWTQLNDVYAGLESPDGGAALRIYPLPMHDKIVIAGDFRHVSAFEAIDATGAVMVRRTGFDAGAPVDVTSLAPGLYILRITTESGVYIRKALKL